MSTLIPGGIYTVEDSYYILNDEETNGNLIFFKNDHEFANTPVNYFNETILMIPHMLDPGKVIRVNKEEFLKLYDGYVGRINDESFAFLDKEIKKHWL